MNLIVLLKLADWENKLVNNTNIHVNVTTVYKFLQDGMHINENYLRICGVMKLTALYLQQQYLKIKTNKM
jgi:hypothetical protein